MNVYAYLRAKLVTGEMGSLRKGKKRGGGHPGSIQCGRRLYHAALQLEVKLL